MLPKRLFSAGPAVAENGSPDLFVRTRISKPESRMDSKSKSWIRDFSLALIDNGLQPRLSIHSHKELLEVIARLGPALRDLVEGVIHLGGKAARSMRNS